MLDIAKCNRYITFLLIVCVSTCDSDLFGWFFFFVSLQQKDEVYLNLVLDYVPETVYRVARHYSRAKQTLPMVYVKVSKCVCLCPLPSIYHHNIRSIISQSAMSGHSSTLCATKCFFWKEIVKEMVI